jgi:hypothetical protein
VNGGSQLTIVYSQYSTVQQVSASNLQEHMDITRPFRKPVVLSGLPGYDNISRLDGNSNHCLRASLENLCRQSYERIFSWLICCTHLTLFLAG